MPCTNWVWHILKWFLCSCCLFYLDLFVFKHCVGKATSISSSRNYYQQLMSNVNLKYSSIDSHLFVRSFVHPFLHSFILCPPGWWCTLSGTHGSKPSANLTCNIWSTWVDVLNYSLLHWLIWCLRCPVSALYSLKSPWPMTFDLRGQFVTPHTFRMKAVIHVLKKPGNKITKNYAEKFFHQKIEKVLSKFLLVTFGKIGLCHSVPIQYHEFKNNFKAWIQNTIHFCNCNIM